MHTGAPTDVIAIEHAGKWLAWDFAETTILASADTYEAAKEAALATGELKPVLARAPESKIRYL